MSQQEKKEKRVVLIGQVGHGKTTLTSAINKVLDDNKAKVELTLVDGQASSAMAAEGALLVVSAPDGPMGQTKEHLGLAKKSNIEVVCVFLNKVDLMDDDELVELVESEVQELLNAEGFPGDDIPIVRGSALEALEENETGPIGKVVDALKKHFKSG
jgi:translation elongation factor EF-Tu-like GTPase